MPLWAFCWLHFCLLSASTTLVFCCTKEFYSEPWHFVRTMHESSQTYPGFTFFFPLSLFSGHLFILFSPPSYCLCSLYSHCTNYHLIYLKYLLFCRLHKNVYFIGLQMMAQWLRTLSAFTEELSYLPSTKWWLTVITLVPGFWCTLLASSGMWCMYVINTGKTHINMRKKI